MRQLHVVQFDTTLSRGCTILHFPQLWHNYCTNEVYTCTCTSKTIQPIYWQQTSLLGNTKPLLRPPPPINNVLYCIRHSHGVRPHHRAFPSPCTCPKHVGLCGAHCRHRRHHRHHDMASPHLDGVETLRLAVNYATSCNITTSGNREPSLKQARVQRGIRKYRFPFQSTVDSAWRRVLKSRWRSSAALQVHSSEGQKQNISENFALFELEKISLFRFFVFGSRITNTSTWHFFNRRLSLFFWISR